MLVMARRVQKEFVAHNGMRATAAKVFGRSPRRTW